jgi:hypothetical protein
VNQTNVLATLGAYLAGVPRAVRRLLEKCHGAG